MAHRRATNFARAAVVLLLLSPATILGHGGVVEEDDLCVINIGYFRAHFKIYLPEARAHRQYCEDLPESGNAIFVMEYLHDSLSGADLGFRIIDNVTGLGRFTRGSDVAAVGDLERVTVFHDEAGVVTGVYTALHRFEKEGEYVGIVTAELADGQVYEAVFPFRVGPGGLGVWPWFAGFALLLQLQYWYLKRNTGRWLPRPPRLEVVRQKP